MPHLSFILWACQVIVRPCVLTRPEAVVWPVRQDATRVWPSASISAAPNATAGSRVASPRYGIAYELLSNGRVVRRLRRLFHSPTVTFEPAVET